MGNINKQTLNILILHDMGDPNRWLSAVRDRELCVLDYSVGHRIITHDASIRPSKLLRRTHFHGIILGPTFLYNRMYPHRMKMIMKDYAFIADSHALKIAFPQDEYDSSSILEDWLLKWKVDRVYSVLDNWKKIYPRIVDSTTIRKGYTAYISDELLSRTDVVKVRQQREIDVSYRSKKSVLGELRYKKGIIGERFTELIGNRDYKLDISTNSSDTIVGEKWLDFIENSKFVLCGNSGSDFLDVDGSIKNNVSKYLQKNPEASFVVVKNLFFSSFQAGEDFTAISPRNIEAALLETVQICDPGKYGDIMKMYEDYIPFRLDGSNIEEVIQIIEDEERVKQIATSCKNKILSVQGLRYREHVNEILEQIMGHRQSRVMPIAPSQTLFHDFHCNLIWIVRRVNPINILKRNLPVSVKQKINAIRFKLLRKSSAIGGKG